ncbi:MAG: phosphopantetheine-binding protein [Pseudomonadota bacterium]
MQTLNKVKHILSEILDVDEDQITQETFLIRELDAESIDLLEVALELAGEFKMEIKEADLFLRNLRIIIEQAREKGMEPLDLLKEKMGHIPVLRLAQMLEELPEGPVLKVKDLVSYIDSITGQDHVA